MHTISRMFSNGNHIGFEVKFVDEGIETIITNCNNIDEATHLANRLNGGMSGEVATLVLMLKQMRAEEQKKAGRS